VLSTTIDLDDSTASLDLALQVASYFELGEGEAHRIAGQVGQAVATWRKRAAKLGLTPTEIDRMASAFEHKDLQAALALCSPARRARNSPSSASVVTGTFLRDQLLKLRCRFCPTGR
jgi:hypothetical protein